jgi:hypothetical protein
MNGMEVYVTAYTYRHAGVHSKGESKKLDRVGCEKRVSTHPLYRLISY